MSGDVLFGNFSIFRTLLSGTIAPNINVRTPKKNSCSACRTESITVLVAENLKKTKNIAVFVIKIISFFFEVSMNIVKTFNKSYWYSLSGKCFFFRKMSKCLIPLKFDFW